MRVARITMMMCCLFASVTLCGCASMNRGATFRSQTPQTQPTPIPDPGPGGAFESSPSEVPLMGPELGNPGAARDPYGRPIKTRNTRRPPVAATRPSIEAGPGSGYVELPPPRD